MESLATEPAVARYGSRLLPMDRWPSRPPERIAARILNHHLPTHWRGWREHLARRKRPDPLAAYGAKRKHPLLWASSAREGVISGAVERYAKMCEYWRGDFDPLSEFHALECLAIAGGLPELAEIATPEVWWNLVAELSVIAEEAAAIDTAAHPWHHQLLAVELPITLAYWLPELAAAHELRNGAHKAWFAAADEWFDGQGMPAAHLLPWMRPLLACWTRALAIDAASGKPAVAHEVREQYEWLVRQTLRLTRGDGTHVFSDGEGPGAWPPELFAAALALGNDKADWAAARLALPEIHDARQSASKAKKKSSGKLAKARAGKGSEKRWEAEACEPYVESEWSQIAVLRPSWSRKAPRLTVAHQGARFRLELESHGTLIASGLWDPEIRVDQNLLAPSGEWSQICWESDEDVDYIELELDFADEWRLQRQMMLARKDRFLFLADVLLAGERSLAEGQAAHLQYRSCLPLVESIAFQAAAESREGLLAGKKPLAQVLPLALPEWRSDRRGGNLTMTNEGLVLQQGAMGHNMMAPLFFDLDPRRFSRPLTWRQLTVAENLAICPPDVACGFRIQIGKEQWLAYRSLAGIGNRTILGQNLVTDFLFARFLRDGSIETMLEVDDEED